MNPKNWWLAYRCFSFSLKGVFSGSSRSCFQRVYFFEVSKQHLWCGGTTRSSKHTQKTLDCCWKTRVYKMQWCKHVCSCFVWVYRNWSDMMSWWADSYWPKFLKLLSLVLNWHSDFELVHVQIVEGTRVFADGITSPKAINLPMVVGKKKTLVFVAC